MSAGRAGRKPKITPEQEAAIGKALQQGPRAFGIDQDLWTLPDLAVAIERICGVTYRPTGVWYLLERLGWNLRRVERRTTTSGNVPGPGFWPCSYAGLAGGRW